MKSLRKKIYAAAGYNTLFFGPGRREFDPSMPMPTFESYLKDAAEGSSKQVPVPVFDEGVIANFMAPRFLKQANLPGFLPAFVPSLLHKPCTGVEGACGSGGRAIATAVRSVLSDAADSVFVLGFEVQNSVKSVYGADILAGASYFHGMRKEGYAHFFPGLFAERAGAYYQKYGQEQARRAMAAWYEQSILNARKNPKAQEYQNRATDLFALGMTEPDPARFVPYLNLYDCSKVTDGAAAVVIASEEGLRQLGIDKASAVEIVAVGGAEGDITQMPSDPTTFAATAVAAAKALEQAGIGKESLGLLELHDCFTITALLAIEALGFADRGRAGDRISEGWFSPKGRIPTNLSGGLGGFGHPVGASGVRQLVDLLHQLTGKAAFQSQPVQPYGMMISMGGNDVTVTAVVVKAIDSI